MCIFVTSSEEEEKKAGERCSTFAPPKEDAQKQDANRSTRASAAKGFVIRRTTDEPKKPQRPPKSQLQLPPVLFTLPQTAASEVAERNAKAKEAPKMKQGPCRKPKETVRRASTRGGDKACKDEADNNLYFGDEDLLPKSLPVKNADDPIASARLTKSRPSIEKFRNEFRKKVLKPAAMLPMSGTASLATSTPAGPSSLPSGMQSASGVQSLVDKSSSKSHEAAEKSGDQRSTNGHATATKATHGCIIVGALERKDVAGGGVYCAYLIASLVVLALAGLVLLLTTLLLQMYAKKKVASSSVRKNASSRLSKTAFDKR
ncbi:hypothetical protein MTO96_003419 [Rhipicephalus appendiculatus]